MIKRVISLLIAFVFCISSLPVSAFEKEQVTAIGEERSEALPEKPDYLAYIENQYNSMQTYITEATFYGRIGNVRRMTNYMAVSAMLYKYTGKEEYLERAKWVYKIIISEWNRSPAIIKNTGDKFFTDITFMIGLDILMSTGYEISKREMELIRADVRANAELNLKADDNQGFSLASGMLRAAKLFPNDPYADKWRRTAEEIFERYAWKFDSDENAGNYNAIAMFEVIQLARGLGREDVFRNPLAKESTFDRYKYQMTNFGIMPEYGDDYFGEWQNYVVLMEYAARLYNDPTYLYYAWRAFSAGNKNFPKEPLKEGTVGKKGDSDLWSMQELYEMLFIIELGETDMQCEKPENRAVVTKRKNRNGVEYYNKLVLSSDNSEGAPFVFADLYADGWHGHFNRRGSVGYYEAGGVPQFYGTARHNRSHVHSNVFAMMEPSIEFPMFDDIKIKPDEWVHETVPLEMLNSFVGKDSDYRMIDRILIRLAADNVKENRAFIFDNLRLEGPAGTLMIDDLEAIGGWTRTDNPYSLTDQCTEGDKALYINVKPKSGYFYYSPYYNIEFSINDYNTLKYDWCYKSPAGKFDFTGVFRIFDLGVDASKVIDMNYGDINLKPALDEATAWTEGEDSFSETVMPSYGTYDSTLTRRLALLDEGILIIQDNIEAGETADGYNMGPIWHQLTSPYASGENWFNAKNDPNKKYYAWSDGREYEKNDLMVWFEPQEGYSFDSTDGVQIVNNPTFTYVAYTKYTAKANAKRTFITVLYPHRNSPEAVKDAISSKTTGFMCSTVNVKSGGKDITVRFSENGIETQRK